MSEWRWDAIQTQLGLASEWGPQLEQLEVAMGVLLAAEETSAAHGAREAVGEANELAYQLAHWPAGESFDSLVSVVSQLRDALWRTSAQLSETEVIGGAKDELHESLNYLYGSVDDLAATAMGLAGQENS